jgi:2-polyprenyl-3-methyl-5-hydroxy-6-metoxy-1,4-benzoquinol methylase
MSDETWNAVKTALGEHSLRLGPYFANQALNSPRHLLFSLSRYKFAAKLLPMNALVSVLELGCGEGLGTMMLAERGHKVLGVDFDEDAVAHASETLSRPNVSFRQSDFLGQKFGEFDAVVSLDVIEHIAEPHDARFLETVTSNLAGSGFCLIGTPNDTASQYASKCSQIGHVNLFTAEKLDALMRRHFQNVFLFGMNDEIVHTGFYPMAHYLLALGCGKLSGRR